MPTFRVGGRQAENAPGPPFEQIGGLAKILGPQVFLRGKKSGFPIASEYVEVSLGPIRSLAKRLLFDERFSSQTGSSSEL